MTVTSDVEAQALLRAATSDFLARRYESARSTYELLRGAGQCGAWPSFFLGRLNRNEGQLEAAKPCFEEALSLEPDFFWACYEKLTLSVDLDEKASESLGLITHFLTIEWMRLDAPHVTNLETVAHQFWDAGERQVAVRLLEKLWPADQLTEFSLLRLVEGSRQGQLRGLAAQRLQALGNLGSTALRIMAEYYREVQSAGDELHALERLWQQAPKDFNAYLSLARTYARLGETPKLEQLVAAGQSFPPRQRNFVALVTAVEQSDVTTAFAAFFDCVRLYRDAPKGLGIRLAYLASGAGDAQRRDWVAAVLLAFHPSDRDVALLTINSAIRDQDWTQARQLFDRHFGDGEGQPVTVRQAQIEILAYSGKLEQAIDLLRAQAVEGVYPAVMVRTALRVLAEAGLWSEVLEAGLPSIGKEDSFEHFFATMIRAARKVQASQALYEALTALPRPLTGARLRALEAVVEDLVEDGRLADIDGEVEAAFSEGRLRRIRTKMRQRVARPPQNRDSCVYYCADKTYFGPALVSLTALAGANAAFARTTAFVIVADPEIVDTARDQVSVIAQRLGLSIEVVNAASVVGSPSDLRAGYGIFTGGQTLSLAAYYRIFFMKHVVDNKLFANALYIDADTIVRSGLAELLAITMDQPLMARYDTDRQEVRHAVAAHGIRGNYFNSGVMRFDARHPDIGPALDKTIAQAIDPRVKLIFQDQCALNIGFDQRVASMPERFNFFLPPDATEEELASADAVIIHYLDRPKPWDSLYRRNAHEWFESFTLMEELRHGEFAQPRTFAVAAD